MRSISSGLSIYYHCSFGFFWIIFYSFPHYKALLFYLNISPVPTCLVHNCETSWRLAIPICCHSCPKIKFPLILINASFFSCFLFFISGTGFSSSSVGSLLEDESMTTLVCSTLLPSSKQTSQDSKIQPEGQ